MAHSTTREKPQKPYPDYPLFPHATRRWAKKIRGKLHYFGPWDDPQGALEEYLRQRDYLHAGKSPPRRDDDRLKLADLANHFLEWKEGRLTTGELSERTFREYHEICARVLDHFGKDTPVEMLEPSDFQSLRAKLSQRLGPVALGNAIQRVRSLFGYGLKARLYRTPVLPEVGFEKPSEKTLRQARAAKGPKLFTPEEIHRLLAVCGPRTKSMVLLGLNGGLGNADIGDLPIVAADLDAGWLTFPRPKTGVERRIPLWPETVEALRQYLAQRPEPKDKADSHLLFIGPRGTSFVGTRNGYRVTGEYNRAAARAKVMGRTFYDLRRTFQTIASDTGDETATSSIMGHAPHHGDMAARYRQRISDERLRAAVEHVRAWLLWEGGAE